MNAKPTIAYQRLSSLESIHISLALFDMNKSLKHHVTETQKIIQLLLSGFIKNSDFARVTTNFDAVYENK